MTAPAPVPSRSRLAELVSQAGDGLVGADEILGSPESLTALGVSSLGLLRLADALEAEYGVLIDLGDPALYTEGLDGLAARVRRLMTPDAP